MKYLIIIAILCASFSAQAGDGHDHGESAFAGGTYLTSFELSAATIKNLDVKTEKVQKHNLQESLELPCIIKNPPEQSSGISVNYMSKIEKIHVALGDKVKKGQLLFTVFSYMAVRNIDVVSPIDGIVSAQNAKIGQVVQQDTGLAEISTMKYFYAEGLAYLSDDISHIKIGDIAHIKIGGTHDDVIGIVKSFSPIVNAADKTKSVLAYFESKDDHIFPNMHCEMDIYLGEAKSAIAVPKRAVLGEFGHHFVFMKHDGHFEKQEVVLGFANGDKIEILEGLHEGDEVVVNGNYQMQFIGGTPVEDHKDDARGHEGHDHD